MTVPERLVPALLLGFTLTALAAAPVAADWLVTSDGTTFETRGPWEVKGKHVVFRTRAGSLTSLRLSDCDLDASAAVTSERARGEGAPARPIPSADRPPRAVLVLTDADVSHARPAPPSAPAPSAEESSDQGPAGEVVVDSWRPLEDENGIAIRGEVRNDSRDVAGRVQVLAIFRDVEGETIETQPAALSASTLRPGQKAEFMVKSFGLFSYGSVDFEVRHFTLLTGAQEGVAPNDGG